MQASDKLTLMMMILRAVCRLCRCSYHALIDDQVADEAPLGQVVQRCERSRAWSVTVHSAN